MFMASRCTETSVPRPALGLMGDREEVVWRCPHEECGRYFHGTVGYRSHVTIASRAIPTPRCERKGAFLVVQHTLGSYICPVAGCPMSAGWCVSERPPKA